MTEETLISEEISKLRINIEKIEEIVNKANSTKYKKKNLLKDAKEDKLFKKKELKKYFNDIDNFDKIAMDKALIRKAKAKLIKLELEMAQSEYTILQDEYTQTYSEIEQQINN
jgi:hypothetical protein